MSEFSQIIKIIHRTGDKVIVVNEHGDPSYVLMSLDQYERLVADRQNIQKLSEAEFLDHINREVNVWRSAQGNDSNDKDGGNLFNYKQEIDSMLAETVSGPVISSEVPKTSNSSDVEYYPEPVDDGR